VSVSSADDDTLLAERFRPLRHNPLGWADIAYPWGEVGTMLEHEPGPEQWQADLLGHIGDELARGVSPIPVAVRSGHGVGKSSLMAMVRGWAMSTMADTRGIVTANTGAQLVTKTLPEFAKWHHLAINRHWFDGSMAYRYALDDAHRETWRFDAVTWSAENPAAFAGLHNAGRRILLQFDEASEIPPVIWETAEGALTDANTEIVWLAFGNPTQTSGRFAECFGAGRNRWHTVEIDARSVRRTNKALIEEWRLHYGEDSDFFRVRVKGQAPRAGSTQFIGHELVEQAGARIPLPSPHDPLVFGVDVARFGDDQSVIYRRRGYDGRTWPPLSFRGLDTMQLAARVVAQAQEDRPDAIFVDEGGVGAGVVDRLRQLGLGGVLGVNFGSSPDTGGLLAGGAPAESYANKRAEMWGGLRSWLTRGGCIPPTRELRDDLTGVQYGFDRDGRIQLERKEDMKKRGLSSPDYGDALALTFSYPVMSSGLAREMQRQQVRTDDDPRLALMRGS
jgi:hypothetical protein